MIVIAAVTLPLAVMQWLNGYELRLLAVAFLKSAAGCQSAFGAQFHAPRSGSCRPTKV